MRGVVHWDAFGSNGNGVFEYRVNSPDPAQQCQGTYDAEYTRLGAPALDAGI